MNNVVVRASSLGSLFDCPARWEAVHLNGLRTPSSPNAVLGKAVHASTALFDHSTLEGGGLTIEEAAGAAVDAIHKPDEDVEWEDEKPVDVEKVAIALHKLYCKEIAPKQDYLAVEIKCEALHISDLELTLTGTTDRIRQTEDGAGIVDIKTGKQAVRANGTVETKGHTYQIGTYELLAEHSSGIKITAPGQIAGLNAGKTDKAQRTGTAEILDARTVLIGDEETPGILQRASQLIHSGMFFGNPKSMMCHERYCPIYTRCNFRK